MVKTHVAGLAGFGFVGFSLGEGMAGMAVLAIHAILVVFAGFGLTAFGINQSQGVTAATAFLAGHECLG